MVEIMVQLLDRVKETGESIIELILNEDTSSAVLTDDTGEKLILDYNYEEGIWE